ncbi:hypothetical protein [Pedobacter aquatilis]|uniref:hypothetical protein n=1 Tax=Pedobacter aquatilis TaxID=351343 RepID=UPI00292F483C|nr:hypothetical protein [Pedobacter aquatilis]
MRKFLCISWIILLGLSGCKKKICGVITAISTEASPADGRPMYKIYLESGEVVPVRSRGNYQVGEGYCND